MTDSFRPDPPLVIGLLGGVAAGKSAVADLFARRGLHLVDADRLAREVVARPAVREALRSRFGPDILDEEGGLRREEVARRVFDDPQARKDLEAITHPAIRERMFAETAAAHGRGQSVLWDAPLLVEGGLVDRCDVVVFVDADRRTRLSRIRQRGWGPEELDRRESAQAPLAVKRARADYTIRNDGSLAETARQVDALLKDLGPRPDPHP